MTNRINYLPEEILNIIGTSRAESLLDESFLVNFEKNCMEELPLRIGVIGKMKAGKSTLLNALIFKDNVLGMSIVPMTAVLTEISYNEEPGSVVKVEFFNEEDIENLKKSSDNSTEEGERSREHLEAIYAIEGYKSKLGLTQDISTTELNEYTSTEGTLSALVKRVSIKYHSEALKGITIVDTPGFNDPIQSRVEATKMAIKNCQVLLFVHSTTSHYDSSEVAILKSQVELAGTAQLIDVANRVDELPLEEWIEFKQNIERAKANLISSGTLEGHALSLLKNSHTEYVSSLMALLGSRFANNAEITQEEKRLACILCQEFDISQEDFIEYSNISGIVRLINSIAQNKELLMQSSMPNELRGELINTKNALNDKVEGLIRSRVVLSSGVERIEEELEKVERLIPRIRCILSGQSLCASLLDLVSEKKWELLSNRDSRSSEHFTDSNYGNYDMWTSGVKMSNISRYNDFVDNYTRDLRAQLKGFVTPFRSSIDRYLDSMELELIRLDVGGDLLKNFMSQVKGLVSPLFADLSYSVAHYGLNNKLKGNPQKDIYRNEFNQHFSDNYISGLLDGFVFIQSKFNFSEEANDFRDDVHGLASDLRNKLVEAIQDPSKKKGQLNEIDIEISRLNEKIRAIDICINNLESYIN